MPSVSDGPAHVAIAVENLSVTYRTAYERPTVRAAVLGFGRRRRAVRIVDAVRDVSFTVPHGTVLGVVGANGAGKSSLVRAIAGIVPPSKGRITVTGEVSTLLALGVGFNRDLSGRDNIVIGGLAAGLSRSAVQSRCAEIAEFAGLQDVLDLPIRTYSSGMYSRLAFAVAVAVQPDVLIIDEALATGDAAFKAKSYEKIQELCGRARTIVLVSHSLHSLQELSTRAIWLHQGRLVLDDSPGHVIAAYTAFTKSGEIPVGRDS